LLASSGEGPLTDKEDSMSSKITFSRVVGLVFLAAAFWSGTASGAGVTPQGLKADGLRWQAIAESYAQARGTTPAGLRADGLRLQAIADAYANRPAASFYTPQALRAEGLRWRQLAASYAQPQIVRSSGFNWGDASIGAAVGLVFALCAALLVVGVRRVRQEKLAV
jgi:hypothetical protein